MWEVTFCTSPSSSLLNLIEWVIFIFHTLAWPQATNISLRFFMCMDNLTFYLHCRVQHRVADILLDKSVNTRILLANSESLKYSTLPCVELLHFYLFEFNLLLFCCLLRLKCFWSFALSGYSLMWRYFLLHFLCLITKFCGLLRDEESPEGLF